MSIDNYFDCISAITMKVIQLSAACNTLVSRVMSGLYIYPFILSGKHVSLGIVKYSKPLFYVRQQSL